MNSILSKRLLQATCIIVVGLALTVASGLVVTGRNVEMDPGYVITQLWTGEEIPTFACNGTNTQPVTRGLPLTYSYYSECRDNMVVRQLPFTLNWIFWSSLSAVVHVGLRYYNRHRQS